MDARKRSHHAYLQTPYGDTGQLISALDQMFGKNNFKLTMKGSNRWIIVTDRKLTDEELDDIRQRSVKRINIRGRDEEPISSNLGRRPTFRRTTSISPSPSSSSMGSRRSPTWKTPVTKLMHILSLLSPRNPHGQSSPSPTSGGSPLPGTAFPVS